MARVAALQALAAGTGTMLVAAAASLYIGTRLTGIHNIPQLHAALRRPDSPEALLASQLQRLQATVPEEGKLPS